MTPYDPQSLNPYAYSRNNPIILSDPSGLCPEEVCGAPTQGDRGSKPGDGANQVVPDPFTGGVMTVDEWATQVAFMQSQQPQCSSLGACRAQGISNTFKQDPIGGEIYAMGETFKAIAESPAGQAVYSISGAKDVGAAWLAAHADEGARSIAGGRAIVDPNKYDYLFGLVGGDAHNAARSAQNAQQLARVGVYDNPAGWKVLQDHFDDVVSRSDNVKHSFSNRYGDFQIRESLFAGPGGFLKFETTWHMSDAGPRLTTVIPMGGLS